jgi:hypothetical protein
MHFTPQSFVSLLSSYHDINRDSIAQTQIVHSLMKTYWERVLIHDIINKVDIDKELVDYIRLLKEAWLLQISALGQLIRIMKSYTWLLNTDITVSSKDVQYTSDTWEYELHQSYNPWVISTFKNTTYKRTLKTDLQKLL